MAAGRRRQRGRRSGAPRQRVHTQSQRSEKVRCSNHDATHRLVLCHDGRLFEHGPAASADCSTTRLVRELLNQAIVQVACGDQHAMALCRGGELFAWGQNGHGQLGVGSQTTLIPQPQLVKRLNGIPLAQIAAGGAHSAAVSLSGAVYTWGKNDFGQLGLGDTEDRDCPSCVGALEHWKTVFISCGADHTAVLSKEGLVCTFGAGGAGQLGHNSTRNELTPRVVAELWGARVSQVACGRQHTLVYVPALDEVYRFGSDEAGRPGDERKPDQLIPLPINSAVNAGKSCQENNTSQEVTEISAGGNQNIVLCKNNKNSSLNGIATLKDADVDAWISNSNLQRWETTKKSIRLIFSSEACINGSFLEERDKHFKTSKEVSGVDMSEVQRFYEKIGKKPKVFQEVQKEIKKLLPSLSSSPTSPENFRVYLILPFLLQREDDSSYHSLRLLAQAITKLQPKDMQTLECLWSNLETTFFKQLVILYQRVSQKNLSQLIREVGDQQRKPDPHGTETLQILQSLYQVNSRTGFRVQENNFCVPQVKLIIKSCGLFDAGSLQILLRMLTRYPCVFDMQDKINAYYIERNAAFCSFTNIPLILMGQVHWVFPVRRECLLQDIWDHLNNAPTHQFRKVLQVSFVGEAGLDEAGLSRELFSVAARTLCRPGTGAFRRVASGLAWFPSQASSGGETFFGIGTLCGMALYNGYQAPFPFPGALYKKLLGLAPGLEDLEELLPVEGRSLRRILDEDYDHILESLDMDFTIMEEGSMVAVELKENGANIPVTRDNRKEFVDLYVNYVFDESIRKPFEDFKRGFLRGCPVTTWKIFLPLELQMVLQGHTKIDWHLLEKNVKYYQYEKLDQTIRNFWSVFHKLPEEKKKMFLAFLSGCDRIPGCGLEHFRFSIADPQAENPDELCLSASTCQLVLFLPRYSSKSILKKQLLYAIEHNEGFGLS
ncbi:E3 ISG15--protein ligase HERC5 isoform X2 [Opisthocomus hoazin]|uniref:E3 ISG15--protein ligase HERC5 isoform X2 n=1 Tax=Opisthocomus hoazin TaxID=30419 RepID=UPI003F5301B5